MALFDLVYSESEAWHSRAATLFTAPASPRLAVFDYVPSLYYNHLI